MPTHLQHPLFIKKFNDLKAPIASRVANRFLSIGGVCYYLNEENIKTRLYIYNYFSLLNGGPFSAEWVLKVYSTDGTHSIERQGKLKNSETVAIDLDVLTRDLGAFGVCVVHLYPTQGAQTMKNSYTTHFFVEYSTPQAEALLHSLGHFVPKLHKAEDYITSSIRPDGMAFLLVSNCCYRTFHYPKELAARGVRIEIVNSQHALRRTEIEPIGPLGCAKIDLRAPWPDLDSWLGGQPALIRLCGPNILYSPLVVQCARNGFIGLDHFQGLDWDDYDSNAPAC